MDYQSMKYMKTEQQHGVLSKLALSFKINKTNVADWVSLIVFIDYFY